MKWLIDEYPAESRNRILIAWRVAQHGYQLEYVAERREHSSSVSEGMNLHPRSWTMLLNGRRAFHVRVWRVISKWKQAIAMVWWLTRANGKCEPSDWDRESTDHHRWSKRRTSAELIQSSLDLWTTTTVGLPIWMNLTDSHWDTLAADQ